MIYYNLYLYEIFTKACSSDGTLCGLVLTGLVTFVEGNRFDMNFCLPNSEWVPDASRSNGT